MNSTPLSLTDKLMSDIRKFGWWLVVAFVIVLPYKNLFELPIALMAIGGLWLCYVQPRVIVNAPALKPLLMMSACFGLPMLLSLTDAVNFSRSAETVLAFLRFPLAAIFVLYTLDLAEARQRFLNVLGWVLSLTALCVILQVALGGGLAAENWGGFIGAVAKQRAMGHKLAVLSFVYFYWVTQFSVKRPLAWVLVPIYVVAVLFSGARVAWIMMGVSLILFVLHLFWQQGFRLRWRVVLIHSVLWLTVIAAAFQLSPFLHDRLKMTAGLFSGNYEATNAATSSRLPIWRVATRVAQDHWINGVGPRGFRNVYAAYAPPDDFWTNLKPPQIPTHPHQQLLEIAVETGLIGVIGYLLALVYWCRLGLVAIRSRMHQALPWMVAVLIAVMPINAHMAFYASFWSCMTWWLIALGLAFWQAGLAGKQDPV